MAEEELKHLDWDIDGSNSTEPGDDIKKNGYPQGAAPPTEHFNWIWRTIDRWVKKLVNDVNGKEPAFTKKTGFNLDKVDDPEASNVNNSFLVATGKALKKVWDKALEAIGLTNTNKNAILNNKEQIEILNGKRFRKFYKADDDVSPIIVDQGWIDGTVCISGLNGAGLEHTVSIMASKENYFPYAIGGNNFALVRLTSTANSIQVHQTLGLKHDLKITDANLRYF